MARNAGKKNGGGLGRTGRNNGLTLRPKPKGKPAGKTGGTKGSGKNHTKRKNAGKR